MAHEQAAARHGLCNACTPRNAVIVGSCVVVAAGLGVASIPVAKAATGCAATAPNGGSCLPLGGYVGGLLGLISSVFFIGCRSRRDTNRPEEQEYLLDAQGNTQHR